MEEDGLWIMDYGIRCLGIDDGSKDEEMAVKGNLVSKIVWCGGI